MKTMIFEDMMTKEVNIQKNTSENSQGLLLRLALLLCLVVGGVNGAWGIKCRFSLLIIAKLCNFATDRRTI